MCHHTAIKGFDVFTAGPKIKDYESLEWTYIRKNGERFPVQLVITAIKNSEGVITGYVGVATDISQLKAIQEELKKSEQRWQFALEGSGDGIWDWFIDTNTQFLSKRAKEMLGFDESDELSDVEEWDQRIHPNDREKSERQSLNDELEKQGHQTMDQKLNALQEKMVASGAEVSDVEVIKNSSSEEED